MISKIHGPYIRSGKSLFKEALVKSKIKSDMTVGPVSVSSDVSIADAQEIMRTWGMRHLPIVDGSKLVGIISDRDILRALSLRKPGTTHVGHIMTKSPYRVRQDVSVAEVAKTMADNKFGCAIVINDKDEVVGIFTTTNALQLLSRILHEPSEVDYRALQLKEYLLREKRTG